MLNKIIGLLLLLMCFQADAQQQIAIKDYGITFALPDLVKWKSKFDSVIVFDDDMFKRVAPFDCTWGDKYNSDMDAPPKLIVEFKKRWGTPHTPRIKAYDKNGRYIYSYFENQDNPTWYCISYYFEGIYDYYELYCFEDLTIYPRYQHKFEQMANSVKFKEEIKHRVDNNLPPNSVTRKRLSAHGVTVTCDLPDIENWQPWHGEEHVPYAILGWEDPCTSFPSVANQCDNLFVIFSEYPNCNEKEEKWREIRDSKGAVKYRIVIDHDFKTPEKFDLFYYFKKNEKCYSLWCHENLQRYPNYKAEFDRIANSLTIDFSQDSLPIKRNHTIIPK